MYRWSVVLHSNQRTFTANWRGVKLLGGLTPVPSPPPKPAPLEMNASTFRCKFAFHFHTKVGFFLFLFTRGICGGETLWLRSIRGQFKLQAINSCYDFFPPFYFWDRLGHPAGLFSFQWSPITSMSSQLTIRYTQRESMRCSFT